MSSCGALAATLLLALMAWPAFGLQISQVADQAPDLTVFLTGVTNRPSTPAAASAQAASSAAGDGDKTLAALGNTSLPVKSSAPWAMAKGATVVVALDVSASLGAANFRNIKTSLNEVLASLPAASQVALLVIGDKVRTLRGFGPVPTPKWDLLESIAPDAPQTALYQGVLAAQALAARPGEGLPLRRFVLLITDGIDDSDKGFGREEALQKVSSGDAPIFALVLAPQRPPKDQVAAIKSLAQIARASGGGFIQSANATMGVGLRALLAQAMQVEMLTLDCGACVRDGVARPLQLSVVRDGATMTDSREVRLLFGPAPTPPQPKPQPDTELTPWGWGLILVLLVAAAGIAEWVRRRKTVDRPKNLAHEGENESARVGDGEGNDAGEVDKTHGAASAVLPAGNLMLTLDVAGVGRAQVRVGNGDVVLGRHAKVDVPTENDAEASARHAALYLGNGVLMVRDLGSSNGTFLNGTRIVRPEPVQDRDLIVIGRTEVRVYVGQL